MLPRGTALFGFITMDTSFTYDLNPIPHFPLKFSMELSTAAAPGGLYK